jgi:hypothetical protein
MTEDEIRLLSDIFSGAPAKPAPSISEVPFMGTRSIAQEKMQETLREREDARRLALEKDFASRPIPEKLAGAAESAGFIGSTVGRSLGYPFAELYGRATDQPKLGQTFLEGATLPESDLGLEYTVRFGEAMEPVAKAMEASKIPEITPGMLTAPVRLIEEGAQQAARAGQKAVSQAAQRLRLSPDLIPLQQTKPVPVQPQIAKAAVAPEVRFPEKNEMGFYSPAEQAALNLRQEKGTGDQFLAQISKTPGVKQEELEWTGLNDFLKGKKSVTKQEVQDYISQNRVNVTERVLGLPEMGTSWYVFSSDGRRVRGFDNEEMANAFAAEESARRGGDYRVVEEASEISSGEPTKFSKLTLPGGENYREILLKLPNQWEKPRALQQANSARIKELRDQMYGTSGSNEIRAEISRLNRENELLQKQINDAPIYKSGHFDQPNVLAHVRINDRTDADGNRVLFVEELQSDWGQQGKKKGFADKPIGENAEYQRLLKQFEDGTLPESQYDRFYELQDLLGGGIVAEQQGSIPTAPFVTNTEDWLNLSLKRLITEAVNKGYDRVAFINGQQSADRYDLSKSVKRVGWTSFNDDPIIKKSGRDVTIDLDSEYLVLTTDDNGKILNVPDGSRQAKDQFIGKDLDEVIGKDLAKQIISKSDGSLSGEGLKIGGEGMRKFYDQIVPNTANKLLKKLGGGKLEPMQLESGEQLGFTITPKMRELVKSQGVPMFAKGGRVVRAVAEAGKKAKQEQKMLQGFYRGYAGDYDAAKAAAQDSGVFVSPQRAVAEYYAEKRAGQTGLDPHLEMILADPFSGRGYGHSTMGTGKNPPMVTRARELAPEDVEARTQLKKKRDLACL